MPFVIAVAGSVAVGKSTTARLLQTLLAAAPGSPRVDLVTTDGFLMPNAALEARGLLGRKGFPESYDRRALLRFLADVKSGREEVFAPVYDHQSYDIVPGRLQAVDRPDILVVEGLNVLQAGRRTDGTAPEVFLSDFFDFSVYVDAAESRHPALVRRAVPRPAPDGVPRHHRLLPPVRRADRRAGPRHRAGHLGRGQRAEPAQQHRARPGRGPGSCCRRPATTRCAASCSASSDPPTRRPDLRLWRRVTAALAGPADSLG